MCEEKIQEKAQKLLFTDFMSVEEFHRFIDNARREDNINKIVTELDCIQRSLAMIFNCNVHSDQVGWLKDAQKRLNEMVERWENHGKELEEKEKIRLKNEKKTLFMERAPARKKK
jgi:hypothetical protein